MKKAISSLLIFMFLAVALASCSVNHAGIPTNPTGSAQSPAAATVTPTPVQTASATPVPAVTPAAAAARAAPPAEQFIGTHSGEAMNAVMDKMIRLLAFNISFASVDSLTSRALFQFYIGVQKSEGMEQWYHKDDRTFYVPVKDVRAVLDQYFDGYIFDPGKAFTDPVYDKEKDVIALKAYGIGFTEYCKIENVKAISDSYVEIDTAFYDAIRDSDSTCPVYRMRLVIKVTDIGYHYISLLQDTVQIDLATDVLLANYNSVYEYVNDKEGTEILIRTVTSVKDFAFIKVRCEEKGGKLSLIAGEPLFSVDELPREKPFEVRLLIPGSAPAYGISFVDETGTKRYYTINLSGRGAEEGPLYSLLEFQNGGYI